jgi:Kef-type K+ transport system membrane component KefB/nucleotide-binding universal stress UspA family protein
MPSVIGLIIAGMIVGPFGFGLLEKGEAIKLFGKVGLLYIMFLAGLELEIVEFLKNKNRSITFGLLTFTIPLLIGFPVCLYVLNLDFWGSLLVASMFSTHTLISYPILSKLGIKQNQAVTITVGGTIITDTLVLLLFAFIISFNKGESGASYWITFIVSLVIFGFILFYIIPKVANWFFKNIESEKTNQFIFVLALLFLSGFLAELAGMEAIIGAFMAGLALNRLIPHSSPLMNKIEFVGNAIFIPFFLISVGMIIDLQVLTKGPKAIFATIILTIVAIVGKFLASFFTQKIFKYSKNERNIILGLSSAHAAATLAIITVGFEMGLIGESVLNGTVVLILITCLFGSYITERAGKKLILEDNLEQKKAEISEEQILVPISNPETIENLLDLAIFIRNNNSSYPIKALTVVRDNEEAKKRLDEGRKMLQTAKEHAIAAECNLQIISRIDLNVGSGIVRTIKEINATIIVIGRNSKKNSINIFFGSTLNTILTNTWQMLLVCNLKYPINIIKKIHFVLPSYAEVEFGFINSLEKVIKLTKETSAEVIFYGNEKTIQSSQKYLEISKSNVSFKYKKFVNIREIDTLSDSIKKNDLLIVTLARKGTLSYQACFDNILDKIEKTFVDISNILLYPEQSQVEDHDYLLEMEDSELNPIQENLERLNNLSQNIKKIFQSRQNKEE